MTTEPDVLEEALKRYTGKPAINSINFEDGGKKLHKVPESCERIPICSNRTLLSMKMVWL